MVHGAPSALLLMLLELPLAVFLAWAVCGCRLSWWGWSQMGRISGMRLSRWD